MHIGGRANTGMQRICCAALRKPLMTNVRQGEMKNYPPKLFLSHSSADKEFVDRLAMELHNKDLRIWYDKWEIKVGDSIVDRINEGLGAADHLVIVLSQASVASPWVREELNAATIRRIKEGGAYILPVLIQPCEIPPLLSHLRYADFQASWETGLHDLLAAIIPDRQELVHALKAVYRQIKKTIDGFGAEFDDSGTFGELVRLDQLLLKAVNLRCLFEQKEETRFASREVSFFDELSFLESTGIQLRSSAWSLLRECRCEFFHSANCGRYPVSLSKFKKLRGGMAEIQRIARRICMLPNEDTGAEQSAAADGEDAAAEP